MIDLLTNTIDHVFALYLYVIYSCVETSTTNDHRFYRNAPMPCRQSVRVALAKWGKNRRSKFLYLLPEVREAM